MTTAWTKKRLRRLCDRYNCLYWRGRLPVYDFELSTERRYLCLCDSKQKIISLRVEGQRESEVRSTLLHEMCHAAAGGGHGSKFWEQIERLPHADAPIEIGSGEAEGNQWLNPAMIPRRFVLARRATAKWRKVRDREIEAWTRKCTLESHLVTREEIIQRFEDVASELTWQPALLIVGREFGLLDVDNRPLRWAKSTVADAQRAFRRARKVYLDGEKRLS